MSNLKYLALGDSYTIGEAVKPEERWTHQLVELLKNDGIDIDFPDIIAVTGWTTNELQAGIKAKQPSKNYDLVSLLIGVNNQYRNYPIETYRKEFTELLNAAISYGEKVFVVSIPDYGTTPFGESKEPKKIALEIDDYNDIAKSICDVHNIPFINITTVSMVAKNNSKMTATDELHPTGKMYQLWTKEIHPVVFNLLK